MRRPATGAHRERDHRRDRRTVKGASVEPKHGARRKPVGQLDGNPVTPGGALGPRQLAQAEVVRDEHLIEMDQAMAARQNEPAAGRNAARRRRGRRGTAARRTSRVRAAVGWPCACCKPQDRRQGGPTSGGQWRSKQPSCTVAKRWRNSNRTSGSPSRWAPRPGAGRSTGRHRPPAGRADSPP